MSSEENELDEINLDDPPTHKTFSIEEERKMMMTKRNKETSQTETDFLDTIDTANPPTVETNSDDMSDGETRQ